MVQLRICGGRDEERRWVGELREVVTWETRLLRLHVTSHHKERAKRNKHSNVETMLLTSLSYNAG